MRGFSSYSSSYSQTSVPAIILGSIWFGMVLVSGISWRHLAVVFFSGVTALAGLWGFLYSRSIRRRVS